MDRLGCQFFLLNKNSYCFLCTPTLSLAHLSQTRVGNFARGCFIFNNDVDSLTPYKTYKLCRIMLKKEKFLGLPKHFACSLYIKLQAAWYVNLGQILNHELFN